jgi:hypothetical protein
MLMLRMSRIGISVCTAFVLITSAPMAAATPIGEVNYLSAFKDADLVCFGRFTAIAGKSAEELLAQHGALGWFTEEEFKAEFNVEAVFKGVAKPGQITLRVQNRNDCVAFGASTPKTGLILFLKQEDDHFRLVENTIYCGLAVYTGGNVVHVNLPDAPQGDSAAQAARSEAGRQQLWVFLRDAFDESLKDDTITMTEYPPEWRDKLLEAVKELGDREVVREYLMKKSYGPPDSSMTAALRERYFPGRPYDFKEGWEAYRKKEITIDRLRSLSYTLLGYDNGKHYPHLDILEQALQVKDPIIVHKVVYALRHSGADEAVPILIKALDLSNLNAQHLAVLGLWESQHDDKRYPITPDYGPGDKLFRESPQTSINLWKTWWKDYGSTKYAYLSKAKPQTVDGKQGN